MLEEGLLVGTKFKVSFLNPIESLKLIAEVEEKITRKM